MSNVGKSENLLDIRGDRILSWRIDCVRLLAVLAIVIFHIPPGITSRPEELLAPLYSDDMLLVRVAARTVLVSGTLMILAAITALLVFGKAKPHKYVKNVTNWARSLLVPYVFWGLAMAAILFGSQYFGLMTDSPHQLVPLRPGTFFEATFGIFRLPANTPIYFLRNLFLLLLLTPLVSLATRKLGLLPLITAVALAMAGTRLPLFGAWSMPLGFLLGAWLATRPGILRTADNYGSFFALAYLATTGTLTWLIFRGFHGGAATALDTLADLLSLPTVWWLSHFFMHPRLKATVGRLAPYTFPVFCMHVPAHMVLWKVYRILSPDIAPGTYLLFLGLAMPLAVFMCVSVAAVSERFAPGAWALVMGRRTRTLARQPLATDESR